MACFSDVGPMAYPLLLGCCLVMSACTAASVQHRASLIDRFPMQFSDCRAMAPDQHLYWEQSFPSGTLRTDVQTLIAKNLDLKAARARVDQAAAAYGIRRSQRLPAVHARADVDRSRVKDDDENTTTTGTTIAFEAALKWELDLWGRLKNRQAAAALAHEKQRALAERTTLDLTALLVESWVSHHAACELERVLLAQRKTNRQFLALNELRLAQGQGSALDVLQQRGRLNATERALPEVRSRKRRTANAYSVLMGQFPDGGGLMDGRLPVVGRLTTLPTPRQLLDDRPDLRAAFLALQAADHEVAAAIADRLPRLSIGMTVAKSGSNLANVGDGGLLEVAGGLLAPVFDAGRLKAKVAQREAQARELLAILEQATLVAVQEVEDAWSRELTLFDEQHLLQDDIANARDTVDRATLRYVNGQESFLAVLIALVQQQTLQQNAITLQQELLINRSRLLRALGAKWNRSL